MVQLNSVPIFGAKNNTGTIWRKLFTEISVQMVSAQGFGIIRQTGDESKHGMRDAKDNRRDFLLCRRRFALSESREQTEGKIWDWKYAWDTGRQR